MKPTTSAATPAPPAAALYWTSGLVALLSLLACVAVPIWFFAQGSANYDQRLATFKTAILCLSVIHLASATVWAIQKDKRRGGF
jgi:hypothetical protein